MKRPLICAICVLTSSHMDHTLSNALTALHATPVQWVLALTGGGASVTGDLFVIPGGSRTLLEIVVPYHEQALAEFLGCRPASFCSAETSRAMARRALDRAQWLSDGAVLGLGCTASLVSDRPKRGEHRAHVSIAGQEGTRTWSVVLAKGARTRAEEESVAARLILHAMVLKLDLPFSVSLPLLPDEQLEERADAATSLGDHLDKKGPLFVAADGRVCPDVAWDPQRPMVLVPGAFNPLHGAHLALARLAQEREGKPVAFELSLSNVDKPELLPEEVQRRLRQFIGHAPVWLTRAARFVDKARLFPGATFVLGADTAERLVMPRYYEGDEQRLREALEWFRRQGCHFLVAARCDGAGHVQGLDALPIPTEARDLFRGIPADEFLMDVSSTRLRSRPTS